MTEPFWTGGPDELAKALRKEFKAKLLQATSDAEKAQLKDELDRKLADIKNSQF